MGRSDVGRDCVRCGGLVAAERISAHPSGVTVEYGRCLRCGTTLRRLLHDGDHDAPPGPPGPWVSLWADPPAAEPAVAWRRAGRSPTRPRGQYGRRRPRR